MIPLLSKYLSVFLIGVLELWGAIPAGLALKLNPPYVAVISALGAATGAFLVLIIGEPLRKWIMSLRKTQVEKESGKYSGILKKYGIPGLCLISPLLLGAHLGAAIGLTLGGKKPQIALWMTVSCFIWSGIFTAVGTMGISFFNT